MTRRNAVADAPSAPEVRRWLHRTRRIRDTSPWYRLYVVALLSLPLLIATVSAEAAGGAERTETLIDGAARWAPFVIALVLLGIARMATWAGLVVPERAEVAWVFSAPLARSALLRPRVVRSVVIGSASGAVMSYLAVLLLVLETDLLAAVVIAKALFAGSLLGAFGAGLVWWVQISEVRARTVLRWSLPATLLVLAVAAVAAAIPGVATAVAWSGPWGWATSMVLLDPGPTASAWTIATGLMTFAGLGAAGWTISTAHRIPHQELARRAEAMSGIRAAMFFLDLRHAAELRRTAQRSLRSAAARRVRPPTRPSLIVPWNDLVDLLRSPGWAVTGLVTTALIWLASETDALRQAAHPPVILTAIGVVGAAVVAMQVLGPLRTERSYPFADRHLPWSSVRVAFLHLVAPLVLLLVAAAGAWGLAAVLGTSWAVVWPGLVASVLAVPVVIGTAALGATLPPPSINYLTAGETGAMILMSRLVMGPQLNAGLVFMPAALVLAFEDVTRPGPWLVAAAIWSALASSGIAWWLRRRIRLDDAEGAG